MLLTSKVNQQTYTVSSSNPFLFKSSNPSHFRCHTLNITSYLLKGNNSTKKRVHNDSNKENSIHPNMDLPSTDFGNYSLFKPKLRSKLISKKRVVLPTKKIYFEDEENNGALIIFPLYEEHEAYNSDPLNENFIQMAGDEDVKSDDEMIEKGSLFLLKEIKYGIVAFSQKRNGL